MNPNHEVTPTFFKRIALPTMLLFATTLPGWAQSDPASSVQRVDVIGAGVSVRAVCPSVEADMLRALARVAMQHRQSGLLDVNFAIDGRDIGDVAIAGGPRDYHRATQRAVRSLACDNGGAGPQTVHMQVVFKDL